MYAIRSYYGTAKRRVLQRFDGVAGALGAGTGGKVGVGRAEARLRNRVHHDSLPFICLLFESGGKFTWGRSC